MLKTLLLAILVFSGSAFATDLTPEQQLAKDRGIALYNQQKDGGEAFLRIAAEAGDAESQYYLGEELRTQHRYVTLEAKKWFEAAAAQGDLYAMLRLARSEREVGAVLAESSVVNKTPKQWQEQARKIAIERAEQGDAEAMYILYLSTGDREWLVRSAESGFPQGQYLLADIYKSGEGFFFLPNARQDSIERWTKEAALAGHPKAMMEYAFALQRKGDLKLAQSILEKTAETGYQAGVSEYGGQLAHLSESFSFPKDLVKGYGLTSLLLELDGGGRAQSYAKSVLPELEAKMTPEQVEEGKNTRKHGKKRTRLYLTSSRNCISDVLKSNQHANSHLSNPCSIENLTQDR